MRRAGVLAFGVVLAAVVGVAAPAAATPRTPAVPLPTVDPAAPTPTAPYPGGPPRGFAPDGSTVGGHGLDTRGLVVARGAPPLPDGVTAPGWLVADLGTGAVLAARDPHGRYYPASTLKTLTLLTLAHRLPPDEVVTGTDDDERIEGTRVGLVTGGQYPVSLLFTALVLASGNDAAHALAQANGGVAVTVAEMNATARAMGAYDTVAGTASGLDVAGQSSSPYDLALFFRALLADPATAAILRTRTAQIPPAAGRPGFQIQDQNPLLTGYPGDLGGKNGFTDAARHTFVTAAERGGRRIVVTIMGTERRPVSEYDQAARLLDWGFAVPPATAGVGRLVRPGDLRAAPSPARTPAARATPAARLGTTASAQGDAPGFPWTGELVAAGVVLAGAAGWGLRRRRGGPGPVSGADR